ncbi:MAG: hypothetical protein JKY15_01965 [Deltaproteobacteria bacterium]|nr:hypothetical protein [Deltaproteobacteria bacterium]
MTVRIPLDVSTTGVENVKEIEKIVEKVKEEVKEIIDKSDVIEESSSTQTGTTTGTKKGKKKKSEKQSKIDEVLKNDLGFRKGQNLLNYATNPSGAILQELLKTGALPAAIIGAPVVAAKVIEFLQQEGNLLDRFFDDRIDNRTDALRDKDKLQRILQGFDQLIISTIDGDLNVRNQYNSFEVFESDRKLLENDFKIRKNVN